MRLLLLSLTFAICIGLIGAQNCLISDTATCTDNGCGNCCNQCPNENSCTRGNSKSQLGCGWENGECKAHETGDVCVTVTASTCDAYTCITGTLKDPATITCENGQCTDLQCCDGACVVEDNTEYVGTEIGDPLPTAGVGACCSRCSNDVVGCVAWTYERADWEGKPVCHVFSDLLIRRSGESYTNFQSGAAGSFPTDCTSYSAECLPPRSMIDGAYSLFCAITGCTIERCCTALAGTDCVAAWGDWGDCSATCGGGVSSRTYTISVDGTGLGTKCEHTNGLQETQSCNNDACLIDLGCAVETGSLFDGSVLEQTSVPTQIDCCRNCQQNSSCVGWNFQIASTLCTLLDVFSFRNTSADYISGTKDAIMASDCAGHLCGAGKIPVTDAKNRFCPGGVCSDSWCCETGVYTCTLADNYNPAPSWLDSSACVVALGEYIPLSQCTLNCAAHYAGGITTTCGPFYGARQGFFSVESTCAATSWIVTYNTLVRKSLSCAGGGCFVCQDASAQILDEQGFYLASNADKCACLEGFKHCANRDNCKMDSSLECGKVSAAYRKVDWLFNNSCNAICDNVCPMEAGVQYVSSTQIDQTARESAQDCCNYCNIVDECVSWTYEEGTCTTQGTPYSLAAKETMVSGWRSSEVARPTCSSWNCTTGIAREDAAVTWCDLSGCTDALCCVNALDVDCNATITPGSCSSSCGGGTRQVAYTIITPASGNGAACKYDYTGQTYYYTEDCNQQPCTNKCADRTEAVTYKPCVFPFVYSGVTYWDCTDVDNEGVLWCPTSVNETTSELIDYGTCITCPTFTCLSITEATSTSTCGVDCQCETEEDCNVEGGTCTWQDGTCKKIHTAPGCGGDICLTDASDENGCGNGKCNCPNAKSCGNQAECAWDFTTSTCGTLETNPYFCALECTQEWSSWSTCSIDCTHTRTSTNGCPGTETEACYTGYCPACQGSWSEWSDCSKTCDGGSQTATFSISRMGPGCEAERGATKSQECNTQSCEPSCANYPCPEGIEVLSEARCTGGVCTDELCCKDCRGYWVDQEGAVCSRTCGGGVIPSTFHPTKFTELCGDKIDATTRPCNTKQCPPCGNGKVEPELGEQCDGGPCCDPYQCFYLKGKYCRPARGQCDLPDVCNGKHAACPYNRKKPNFTPCNDHNAETENSICMYGKCIPGTPLHKIQLIPASSSSSAKVRVKNMD